MELLASGPVARKAGFKFLNERSSTQKIVGSFICYALTSDRVRKTV